MIDTQLFEAIKSQRNRCENLMKLLAAYPVEQIRDEIPTAIEDIYDKAQDLIDEHCIEGHD